jgi:outer membrane protein, heavy metal efflux system
MTAPLQIVAAAIGVVWLAGCAGYDPRPLPARAGLAASLAALRVGVPGHPAQTIDISRPLTANEVGLLAILNNPRLKSERGAIAVARAGVVQATLLPNPSASLGYGVLISGPGTGSSIAASLAQDIAAIVTRGARANAAAAHLGQVDADQLWREWQVAQKARQLAADLYAVRLSIALTSREQRLIAREIAQVRGAIASGNLTLAALAPLLSAAATSEQALANLRLSELKDWQSLDGLLGLVPGIRFAIARPEFGPLPAGLERLIAELPARRPDLAALRLGYRSAEEDVRAAILGQFPAFSVGPAYGSDTSNVVTLGPSFTFALPVFDRNQGRIAKSRATRQLLREQYQARLDDAAARVRALLAQLRRLAADIVPARKAETAAAALAATARQAYAQGNLDQRTLTDYETTALERSLQVIAFERQIAEDRIFLAVELGLDLPRARIALPRTETL